MVNIKNVVRYCEDCTRILGRLEEEMIGVKILKEKINYLFGKRRRSGVLTCSPDPGRGG